MLHLFCRHIQINASWALNSRGPLLIACNHPNSFLDAIIICTLFKRPVYSLARGDVFKNKWIARILRSLYIFPVYRTSEGVENLEHNYATFEACIEIFKRNGIVLIFSEGLCINEWHLRPLKKGTARMALSSWDEGVALKIVPVAINYQRFHSYNKDVHLFFGNCITREDVDLNNGFGRAILSFNNLLHKELVSLVYEIAPGDAEKRKKIFEQKIHFWKKALLAIPAALGWFFHLPLYLTALFFAKKFGTGNNHYDSILVTILLLTYPFYIVLFTAIVYLVSGNPLSLLLLIAMPLFAWSYLQIKKG
ncbi:MAG: 1-acyl-sn-glycerol-3-phosphate acyltransferase [Niastella sp.]|nr:1-acyl-sn-glycerol-3-phosphate acyltransferase [Niastella sp.]